MTAAHVVVAVRSAIFLYSFEEKSGNACPRDNGSVVCARDAPNNVPDDQGFTPVYGVKGVSHLARSFEPTCVWLLSLFPP